MKSKMIVKPASRPDERREFQDHGHMDLVHFEDGTSVGKGVFEPGWCWSNDVKPIAGTESCRASHTGYALQGTLAVRMDSGEEFTIRAGDTFEIPPGHDAWVEGNETCELLDFTGYEEYAKSRNEAAEVVPIGQSATQGQERRKIADCRDMPSESNCSLTISGREDEVIRAAAEHAVSVHGHTDSPELREQIRRSLKDEVPEGLQNLRAA